MNSVSNQKVLVGGKTKKTTKCPKNCKCTKCAKKASMKKVVKKPIVKKATTKKTTMKKKVVKGGAKKLIGVKNLGKVWNVMFQKKIIDLNKNKKFKNFSVNNVNKYESNKNSDKKYVLFVIDMQRDFSDVPYKREGYVRLLDLDKNKTETIEDPITKQKCKKNGKISKFKKKFNVVLPNEKHSVTDLEGIRFHDNGKPITTNNKNGNAIGNFNVADSGKKLTEDLVAKITDALSDPNCTQIIFTRDYHPDGHMSFSPAMTQTPYTGCQDGCFPAHCIQGHSGTLFVPAIEDLLLSTDVSILNQKVKILFKGMSDNCDSFTGVQKDNIDNYCSNKGLSNSRINRKGYFSNYTCSSVSGAYEISNLTTKEAITFNNPVNFFKKKTKIEIKSVENNKSISSNPFDYSTILQNASEVQVCGLAGDYCVRDTITALAQKCKGQKVNEKDTKIVLLADLTRYALLPLKSMLALPIHNYTGNMLKPNLHGIDYKLEFEVGKLGNINNIILNFNSTDSNKSLYYYLFLWYGAVQAYTIN